MRHENLDPEQWENDSNVVLNKPLLNRSKKTSLANSNVDLQFELMVHDKGTGLGDSHKHPIQFSNQIIRGSGAKKSFRN